MIFQGPGNLPLINTYLEKPGPLDNWQLNGGDFSGLTLKEREVNRLSCERAFLNETRWENCSLKRPEFRQCSLEGSVFTESLLEEPLFVSCQLRESYWKNLSLNGGVLRGCTAPRLTMESCRLRRFSLHEPEISRARFSRLAVVASLFTAVHESGVTGLRKSEVENSLFINCRFSGTFFSSSVLRNSVFIGCRFVETDWDLVERDNCHFADCEGIPREESHMNKKRSEAPGPKGGWNRFAQEVLNEREK
ncbi:MAG: pentapeptide repeat-containing protein [Spirochaetales bacterium]|nr:pentapeptide repeat-containing protein [Spirochaetales bacterium]